MDKDSKDELIDKLKPLLKQIQQLQEQAYNSYKPQVEGYSDFCLAIL